MKPVSLPSDLEQFISDEVSRGGFESREEVIAEAVRQMHEKQQAEKDLQAEVQRGIDSLNRGEGTVIRNEEEGQAYLDDIKRRGRDWLAHQQDPK